MASEPVADDHPVDSTSHEHNESTLGNEGHNGSARHNEIPFYEAVTSTTQDPSSNATPSNAIEDTNLDRASERDTGEYGELEPIKTRQSQNHQQLSRIHTKRSMTEDDIFRTLSRRRSQVTEMTEEEEEQEIERLMSRMFGKGRQAQSEDEQTRHVGVVWKNLTVKGMGLGAALQPTNGDFFLGLPRFLKTLFKHGVKAATAKPPVRDLIQDFTGCIRPGEMLLVLGRPGAGCSTFLKVLGNQRFGYEGIEGEVTYGGTDSKTMARDFRGEIIYNPEVRDAIAYSILC